METSIVNLIFAYNPAISQNIYEVSNMIDKCIKFLLLVNLNNNQNNNKNAVHHLNSSVFGKLKYLAFFVANCCDGTSPTEEQFDLSYKYMVIEEEEEDVEDIEKAIESSNLNYILSCFQPVGKSLSLNSRIY